MDATIEVALLGRDGGPWFAVPTAEVERFRLPDGRPFVGLNPMLAPDRKVHCAWVHVPVALLDTLYGATKA